ncbi:MAG: ceramidase domain-containing protein [Myxococcus sp.]|nr:ceramidase domain-containing protein [Myxococcus sp.]
MWTDWTPATCMPDSCFCEAVREGAVRQPANTWSSLAFCVAAAVMAWELSFRRESRGLRPVEAACFAAAVFLVGVTSAFYHASLSFFGQWLDVQSMYLVVLAAFSVNVDALRPGRPRRFFTLYLGLNVALGVLLYAVPVLRRYAFGGVIFAIIATEVLLRRGALRAWALRPLWAAVALQALAFCIWTLDTLHLVCAPHSLLQGHAAWHTLGAFASYALWRFYRGAS